MRKKALKYTTVKLDGMLVEEVAGQLEEGETLTGFVREAIRYRLRRSQMRKAAEAYLAALEKDPQMADEMAAWEAADLASPPASGRKGSRQ